jgi:hypothetical protein
MELRVCGITPTRAAAALLAINAQAVRAIAIVFTVSLQVDVLVQRVSLRTMIAPDYQSLSGERYLCARFRGLE